MSPASPSGIPTPDSVPKHATPQTNGTPPSATPDSAAPSDSSGSPMDRRILLGLAGLAGVAALSRVARAGQLDPPPGAIGPTGISLAQLDQKASSNNAALNSKLAKIDAKAAFTDHGVSEPRTPIRSLSSSPTAQFVITDPGAYCMTDNIEQIPGMVCIDIQCSDVDIDGQGFAFHGSGDAAMPPSSCVRSSGQSNLELYDFTFSGWVGCCVDCDDCDDVFVSDCIFRHCTCPPGIDSTGNAVPGAVIRCRHNGDISDVDVSSCNGCALKTGDGCKTVSVRFRDCAGNALTCGDSCSADDFTITNTGGVATGAIIRFGKCGSVSELVVYNAVCPRVLEVGDNSSIDEVQLDQVQGDGIVGGVCTCVEGYQARSCVGRPIRCEDGSCISDFSFHTCSLAPGSPGALLECGPRSSVCDGQVIAGGNRCVSVDQSCVLDCVDISGGSGGGFLCGDDCCLDGCTVLSHTGPAVISGMRTRINELECRLCIGLAVSVGIDSTVECCEVTGGSGGGFLCDDGSCIEDCKVSNHQGVAIQCSSRCSIECCKVVASWGVSCGAECCVHDNELSYDGSGGGGGGGGGALNVLGERSSITSNYVSGQIYLFGGADRCLIEDNHLVGSGGPVGTGGASLSIAAGVTGCSIRSNHVSRASMTHAFIIPPGNSYGPIVNTIAGGDLLQAPDPVPGSHPHANFVS